MIRFYRLYTRKKKLKVLDRMLQRLKSGQALYICPLFPSQYQAVMRARFPELWELIMHEGDRRANIVFERNFRWGDPWPILATDTFTKGVMQAKIDLIQTLKDTI